MLVLSRKLGERIVIGGSVVLTVTAVQGGRVSLAFDAPREVAILRLELEDGRRETAAVELTAPSRRPKKGA